MTEDFTRPAGDPRTLGQDPVAPTGPPVGPPPPVAPPPPGAPAPVSTTPAEQPAGGGQHGDDSSDTKEAAKEQASQVAGNVREQAGQVAGTAKQEAKQTAGEAKQQAQQLLRQSQSELSDQAATQQQRLASGLRSFSSEMGQMADGADEPGIATSVAQWASQVTDDAGRWLEDRDPSSVFDEVRRYARRNPGTFMLIAGGLGLAVGRVARSLKDDSQDADEHHTGAAAGAAGSAGAGPVGNAHGSYYEPPAWPAGDPQPGGLR